MTAPIPSTISYSSSTNIRRFPASKHTKSYLNRPDPVRQQSQARRRNLIKNSLQGFLAGDDKNHNDSKDRRTTKSRERNRNPNFISSMFLSPRQKQRAKALKVKERKDKQKGKERVTKKSNKKTTEMKAIDLKEKLSASQETMLTETVGNSSFDSIQLESSPPVKREETSDNGKIRSPLRTTKKKMKKDGFALLPLSPRKLLSPGRKPRRIVLSEDGMAKAEDTRSSATIIKGLPIAHEILENSQTCVGTEEDLHKASEAIDYIDGADWARLEWNAILPPMDDYNASMRSSRSEMPRRRGSMTHSSRKISRRASCSGNLVHDKAPTKDHSWKPHSMRATRSTTRNPTK